MRRYLNVCHQKKVIKLKNKCHTPNEVFWLIDWLRLSLTYNISLNVCIISKSMSFLKKLFSSNCNVTKEKNNSIMVYIDAELRRGAELPKDQTVQ